jgi:hypothetical protein
MMHQCGPQSPVKAKQRNTAIEFAQGLGARSSQTEDVDGEALARDFLDAGLLRHGDVDIEPKILQCTRED